MDQIQNKELKVGEKIKQKDLSLIAGGLVFIVKQSC